MTEHKETILSGLEKFACRSAVRVLESVMLVSAGEKISMVSSRAGQYNTELPGKM